jgi:quercetin dioxygenase-like cupin family protein
MSARNNLEPLPADSQRPASVEERLAAEGLSASSWGNAPTDTYGAHSHGYDKVLVAATGSITFHLTELGRDVELRAGERLELPAGTMHGATVGSSGVRCLEAHLPAGSLAGGLRHRTDW